MGCPRNRVNSSTERRDERVKPSSKAGSEICESQRRPLNDRTHKPVDLDDDVRVYNPKVRVEPLAGDSHVVAARGVYSAHHQWVREF